MTNYAFCYIRINLSLSLPKLVLFYCLLKNNQELYTGRCISLRERLVTVLTELQTSDPRESETHIRPGPNKRIKKQKVKKTI